MIFADATPNANTTWLVLVALSGIAGNLAQIHIAKMMARRQTNEIYPQPLQVEMARKFTDKQEFERHIGECQRIHENLFAKIGGVERGAAARIEEQLTNMRKESREDRGEIHEKINQARESIAGLEAKAELTNQSVAGIQSDIKRILERRS